VNRVQTTNPHSASAAVRDTPRACQPVHILPPMPGAILLYHRIADDPHDPFGILVSPATFRAHVELLAERYRPVSLAEIAAGVERGRVPERAVAVTFDDGYADNLTEAKPILTAAGVPATVFVASGLVDGGQPLWWYELAQLLDGPPLKEAWRELRRLPRAEIERRVEELRAAAGETEPATGRGRALTRDELCELAAGDVVEIGAHTRTHALLAAHTPDVQRAEIEGGRRDLEEWLGRPVESFAYPFGEDGDFDAATVDLVREAGFGRAVTVDTRPVTPSTPVHELPRVYVPDVPAEQLDGTLADLLGG
jgi:peptidoglycan/xylan/chitin deacetylase (PgdA/CDA1 family)